SPALTRTAPSSACWRWRFDAPVPVAMPPRSAALAMPRMAIAMRISIRVEPSCGRPRTSYLDLVVDAVHRGDQRDGDEANDHTDHDDHGRLEQVEEALHPIVELALVELGGRFQLLVERAGVLADSEHLTRRAGEQ